MFRALVACLHPELYKDRQVSQIELQSQEYATQWCELKGEAYNASCYPGVGIKDITDVEEGFNININMYSLQGDLTCQSFYRSPCKFESTMNLNLYENHVSYIKDMHCYCKKFSCPTCKRQFDRKTNWNRHLQTCEAKLKLVYPGGVFKPSKTVFEELASYGINVPQQDRNFGEFIVFDMKAMLVPFNESNSEKLIWTHVHRPISVAVCSNAEGFTQPYCIINTDIEELV